MFLQLRNHVARVAYLKARAFYLADGLYNQMRPDDKYRQHDHGAQ